MITDVFKASWACYRANKQINLLKERTNEATISELANLLVKKSTRFGTTGHVYFWLALIVFAVIRSQTVSDQISGDQV